MKKRWLNRIINLVIIVIIIAGIGYGGYYAYKKSIEAKASKNVQRERTVKVTRGDLIVNISGTGTVQPISRFDIVPLVRGNILSAPFEEGMKVKEGDVLYKIDESDTEINIEKTRNSIEKFKLNNRQNLQSIKNLEVFAPIDGRLINFSVKVGDYIGSNSAKLADIVNDERLVAKLPFDEAQVDTIEIGQDAQLVTVESNNKIIDGKVISKNDSGIVEILISEHSSNLLGLKAVGVVKSSLGNMTSSGNGVIEYAEGQGLKVNETSGTVKAVYVSNNQKVSAGQKLFELENEALLLSQEKSALDLRDLELTLQSQIKQLKDYSIASPIDGVVIKKHAKAGDTINNTNANTILMTVADMNKMIFNIDVDELDIAKIKIDQQVKVQPDALPGKSIDGKVTNIAAEGKTQNGVTTYIVQVTIDEPGNLKPGMNVNADIFVEKRENVLYLPMAAVQKAGNRTFVNVPTGATNTAINTNNGNSNVNGERTNERPAQSGQRPAARPAMAGGSGPAARQAQQGAAAGSNRQTVPIEVGINNEEYIEILKGLNEGDLVVLPQTSAGSNQRGGQGGMGGVRIPIR